MKIYQIPDLEVVITPPQIGFAGSVEIEEPETMKYSNGGDAW